MNILFLANRFPYPPYRGDKLKIYNLSKRLYNDHNLFLVTFIQDKNDYNYIPDLEKIFKEVHVVYLPKIYSNLKCFLKLFSSKPYQIIYFESKRLKRLIKKFLKENNIDAVHVQHLRMSQYVNEFNDFKKILDLPDAYSLYWKRRANLKRNLIQKVFDRIEYKKVLKFESIIKQFDLSLVCSHEDKEILEKAHGVDNIRILPNGVDLDFFKAKNHDYSINDKIIFTGNMDYAPNVDACVYFVNDIFPTIVDKVPTVKFFIVGQKPVNKILNLQSKNVIVTGFIKEINKEYNNSAVAISPVRFGAGTLNKVLEPMAMGIPVVSTEVGFKGLGIESGEGVILANETKDFADAVVKLLMNKNYRKEIGMKGLNVIKEKFNWDKITKLLENYFEN